jgi:hypothetical protein
MLSGRNITASIAKYMVSEKIQQLTTQFYEWEILGRGWLSADEPVDLEPPFTPFFGHFIKQQTFFDDGLRPTLLSSIVSVFQKKKEPKTVELAPEVSYDLFPFTDISPVTVLQLRISKQSKVSAQEIEQLLTMLSYCLRPISFEIIGTAKTITVQFVCRQDDAGYIKSQLVTYFKGVPVLEIDTVHPLINEELAIATVDFGLEQEFMRPLGQLKNAFIDPLTGLFSILEHLREGEQVVFQVLFNGVMNHWDYSIISSVSDKKGGPFFEDAPEMLPLAKEKISTTLFSVTVRLVSQSETIEESFSILQKLIFALTTNTKSNTNSLHPLPTDTYTLEQRIYDIELRESHRVGMLLNARELATLVHIPGPPLITKKVLADTRKTKSAPTITEGHRFKLGLNVHDGIERTITISNEQRLKHTHIIGATGTGKSTLLLSMISQDIANGGGVAVLDPYGGLIDKLISNIPLSRLNDVILIDPSDSEFPVGFNILKAHSDIEKEILSSDLVAAFRKLSTSWGDQMNSVFANAILAFLESTKGGTLIDMRRFLIEKSYREAFLSNVPDKSISYYWQKEYPLLKTNSIGPILTRLDAFLRPRLIRNMVAQSKGIDFEQVLNKQKILLVKLSQGLIGSENSYLLGTFVVSKIHQAALARETTTVRNNFFLYVDEFQHFITPSMSHILSGTRQYHVGLILAHQDLQQVQKSDNEVLSSLIANAGTRICFRLGDNDAKKMAEGFSFFDAQDLQNLNTGEAIVRIERPEFDFSFSTIPFNPSLGEFATKESVIEQSRQRNSTPKQKVEEMLMESMGDVVTPESVEQKVPERQKVYAPPRKEEVVSIPIDKSVPIPQAKVTDEQIKEVVKKKEITQHRYLQSLIKKMAESKGYRAIIEAPTPDGKGSVDVSIEGNNLKIACEVSVTTDSAWELHNIEKCLSAGYDEVFVCSVDKKAIETLKEKVSERFGSLAKKNVSIGDPEDLFVLLDANMQVGRNTETTIKGYRVKVEYDDISGEAMQKKRESVAKLISDAMKKFKK